MQGPNHIVAVLSDDRLIQPILGFDVLLDFGRKPAIQVEGTARSGPHHEKCDRDHQKHRRNGHQKSSTDEAKHSKHDSL